MTPLAAVVRLAAPTTVVMAVAAVSNIVYTYFVSRLGVEAIGAVSLVFPVSLLAITAMGGGIGSGAASAVARALGAGRRNDAAALAGQALVLSVVIGLGFGLAVQVCAAPLFRLMGGRGLVRPAFRLPRFTLAPVREILRVGVPAALSTSVSNVGLMALTAVVTRLGAADLAAYGLGTRLDFLLMSFGYGLAAAVLTLVGMATGANRHDQVHAFVTRAAAITVVLLGVPGLLLCWRPALWLGLFPDDAGIHAVGAQYFRIIGPSYPFLGISMVIAFAFQGLGRATIPLAWMIVRVAGVLAAAVVCTQGLGLGERAVFTSIAAGNVVSAAGMVALFLLTERRLRAARPAPSPVSELAATGTR